MIMQRWEGVVFSEGKTMPFIMSKRKDFIMKKQSTIKIMIYAAMFLAFAYVIPFLTGQIPQIGSMLCPMHIPVLLCGFICGWPWGLLVGLFAPILRSVTLGMPPLFPTAVCMAFELAAYGAVAGILYKTLPKKKCFIYCALLGAMVIGISEVHIACQNTEVRAYIKIC